MAKQPRKSVVLVEPMEGRALMTHIVGIPHPPPVKLPPIQVPQIPTLAGLSEQTWAEAGRYAYSAAAVTMQTRNANRPEEALPRIEREALRKFFGGLVDRVAVQWGADPVNEWSVGGYKVFLGGEEAEAQTYGYNIYVRSAKENFSARDRLETLAHELVHVEQFERFGKSLSEFGYNYFREYKRAGQNYRNNKLEAEAYDRVDSISDELVAGYNSLRKPPVFCLVGVDGVVTIRNSTTATISYKIRWSSTEAFKTYTLKPKIRRTHSTNNGCGEDALFPQISFDQSFSKGFQAKNYNLTYASLISGAASPSKNPGATYYFEKVTNGIELYRA